MRMYDIIKKKRDGGKLSEEEIKWFAEGYAKGEIPDYQAAALCMAVFFRGMDLEETTALLGTMANAGIKASQGGTALKGAFTRLAREPAMAEKALRSLGVASRDAPLLELDIGEAPPSEHVLLRG